MAELEAVTTVARTGGFRAAARELGVSSSALSHAIAALEERLRVRLFNRTTRSVVLSPAGEQFIAEVGPALAAIDGAIESLGEHGIEPTGTLRLNMALGAARMLLQSLILEYCRRYPRVEVEITTESALVDVIGQGFDAGIRIAEAVPTDMIAVPIMRSIRSVVVGSPQYFSGRTRPKAPNDLLRHRCIRARLRSGQIYKWEFEKGDQKVQIDVPGSLMLDESSLMREAALAGAGLTFIGENSVAEDVSAGRLIAVLEDWSPPYPGLSLYFAGRRYIPVRLRALIDLIRELDYR
jgi:DNA-binding transcriptional LysR family regulator